LNGNGKVANAKSLRQQKSNDAFREELNQTLNPSPRRRIQPYRGLLTWALRHRITTLLIAVAFFIGSLQLIPFIPKGLFDNGDIGLSTILIELPPGSTLSETEDVMRQLNRLLQDKPEVKNVLATAGSVNGATVYVNLVPKDKRQLSQKRI